MNYTNKMRKITILCNKICVNEKKAVLLSAVYVRWRDASAHEKNINDYAKDTKYSNYCSCGPRQDDAGGQDALHGESGSRIAARRCGEQGVDFG